MQLSEIIKCIKFDRIKIIFKVNFKKEKLLQIFAMHDFMRHRVWKNHYFMKKLYWKIQLLLMGNIDASWGEKFNQNNGEISEYKTFLVNKCFAM